MTSFDGLKFVVSNVPEIFTMDNIRAGSSLEQYHNWLKKVRAQDKKCVDKIIHKKRNVLPSYKAYQKAYRKGEKYKAYQKAYRLRRKNKVVR